MARRCRALALIVTWAARVIPGGLLYLAKANPGSGEESRGRAAQRTPFGGWLWSGPMILAGTCLGTGTFRKTLSSRTGRPVNARVNHSTLMNGVFNNYRLETVVNLRGHQTSVEISC